METNGEVGKVNVSEKAYNLIKDSFRCSHHGSYTKTEGDDIKMYFVEECLAPLSGFGNPRISANS
jgi:hypothetical protein